MKTMKLCILAAAALASGAAIAVDSCGGYTSIANPFACSGGGNCVWWTWREATNAGWAAPLPTRNANLWDDVARQYPKLFVVTTKPRPDVKSIGVDESAPYCTQRDAAGSCLQWADSGHVVWINSVSGTTLYTTEMQWGKYGVTSRPYNVSTFQSFVSSTDGKTATEIGCTDGKVVKTAVDPFGNRLAVYASAECKSRWAIAAGSTSQVAVSAQIVRSKGNVKFTRAGFGVVTSPMLQSPSALSVCAKATFNGGTSSLSLCG